MFQAAPFEFVVILLGVMNPGLEKQCTKVIIKKGLSHPGHILVSGMCDFYI